MLPSIELNRISLDQVDITELRQEAAQDGFGMMNRLAEEWPRGANRFDKPGESLMGAFVAQCLVGVAGLNQEPYEPAPGLGRLRHSIG